MKNQKQSKRIATKVAAFALSAGLLASNMMPMSTVSAAYGSGGTGRNVMEYLDRGITAVNTGNGMLVSWRFLANDNENTEFKLYRGNTLVYTSKAGNATCYLDKGGNNTSKYKVETIVNGQWFQLITANL